MLLLREFWKSSLRNKRDTFINDVFTIITGGYAKKDTNFFTYKKLNIQIYSSKMCPYRKKLLKS